MRTLAYLFGKVGSVTDATRRKATETVTAAQAAGHDPVYLWGKDSNPFNTEHYSGRAIDFMVGQSHLDAAAKATGDWIAEYLWANRERFGVRHIIWRQRVRSTVISPGLWRAMADRGNTTANHYDHVHVWFLDDRWAEKPAAAPKPKPVTKPKPTPAQSKARVLRIGSLGEDVRRLQSALRRTFPAYAGRLAVDGEYGPKTAAAVKEFQRRAGGLDVDGEVGKYTRAKLARYGITL